MNFVLDSPFFMPIVDLHTLTFQIIAAWKNQNQSIHLPQSEQSTGRKLTFDEMHVPHLNLKNLYFRPGDYHLRNLLVCVC